MDGKNIKSSTTHLFLLTRGNGILESVLMLDVGVSVLSLSGYKYFELSVWDILLVIVVGAQYDSKIEDRKEDKSMPWSLRYTW